MAETGRRVALEVRGTGPFRLEASCSCGERLSVAIQVPALPCVVDEVLASLERQRMVPRRPRKEA